ncbi:MAG: FtsB family cell division protein [Rubricella sp.]
MPLGSKPGQVLLNVAFAGVALALALSFASAGLIGPRGLQSLGENEARAAVLERELAALRAERAERENLTRRLSSSYLDLDLLDERARAVLGLVRPDEIVIR